MIFSFPTKKTKSRPIFVSLLLVAATVLPGCAGTATTDIAAGREPSSAKVATPKGGWAAWTEANVGLTPQTLWASVVFDAESVKAPIGLEIYALKQPLWRVELNSDLIGFPPAGAEGASRSFLQLLSIHALFEADPRLKRVYVATKDMTVTLVPGLGISDFVRGTAEVSGTKYGVLQRESFVLPAELRDLFQRMIAPVPALPATKQRLNFTGDFDPAEEFRKAGLNPEKMEMVVTEEKGEELSYDVSYFQDRYYLGGVSFASHPERWEDYSGIPSAHLHGRGLGTLFYILATFQLKDFSKKPLVSDGNRSGQATAVWENLVKAGWATKEELPGEVDIYRFKMEALKNATRMKNFSKKRTLLREGAASGGGGGRG